MFERYTEKARRAVFFARLEAIQFGSSYIEPEHLLLGLMHHTVGLSFEAVTIDAIRAEIEKATPRGTPSPASADLPVSSAVKRAFRRAEKEADESGQVEIDVEHLLPGLLAEEDSIVPGILRKYGVDRETSRQSAPEPPGKTPPNRESLRALVDGLPDGALQAAQRTLEQAATVPAATKMGSMSSKRTPSTLATRSLLSNIFA
jgi:ATP-dependent Clp protease ATP-binding subunit ClpC